MVGGGVGETFTVVAVDGTLVLVGLGVVVGTTGGTSVSVVLSVLVGTITKVGVLLSTMESLVLVALGITMSKGVGVRETS